MVKRIKVSVIFIVIVLMLLSFTTALFAGGNGEDGEQNHHFNWWGFLGKLFNATVLFGGLIFLLRKPLIKLLAQKSLDVKNDILQREELLKTTTGHLENIKKRLEKIEEEVENMKNNAEKSGEDETKTYVARCRPFKDRIGRKLGIITVLSDITYLKEINQLKSDFVSMVAHEIKNPMSSVLAQIKVIQDELAGDVTQKQSEILGRVSEKIEGLATLSSELLNLAKKEAGLPTLERIECNMAEILKEQVDFHYQKARAKGIRLELDQLPDLPPVLANKQNMEEVLSNLITNAINYTPEEGKIIVSAQPGKHHLCISVSDTGLGIAKEDIDRIFDQFYRVKNEKTRYIIGTGLGLPIVKGIVEAHNGMIRVESKPDYGSTFSVYIPLITP